MTNIDTLRAEYEIARIIMENRTDSPRCLVKNWEAEERDNPHVEEAVRQARAVLAALGPTDAQVYEWALLNGWHIHPSDGERPIWFAMHPESGKAVSAPTAIEALRNAMKGGDTMIAVTQADRDAACELLGGAAAEAMRLGKSDNLSLIQALARHRIASQAELIEALEYYAIPEHFESGEVPGHIYVLDDGGRYARAALARVKGESK